MASRFVRPDTVKLPLSNGDWILIRKQLTAGEKRDAFGRMYLTSADGTTLTRHPVLWGIHLVLAYLLDWSITETGEPDGKKVEILEKPLDEVKSIVDNLSPEDFREIQDAIEAHEEAMAKARLEAKKVRDGEPTSKPTSSSPSDAAGPSTTSAA